jgi:hypothetical protein
MKMMKTTKTDACPSEFALERWRFGELAASPDEVRIVAHVTDCPLCRDRHAALAKAEQLPLGSDNTDAIWSQATAPKAPRSPSRWRALVWPSAALATVALSVVLIASRTRQPDIITKGSWQLGVIAKGRDGRIARVDPGAALSPGDRLRFEVATGWPHASIALVMLDSAGKVSRLAPTVDRSLSIAGGKRVLLDEAVQLDSTLGPERIVLVGCSGSLEVPDVVASAERALAAADGDPRRVSSLGTGCHEESFWISKVKP